MRDGKRIASGVASLLAGAAVVVAAGRVGRGGSGQTKSRERRAEQEARPSVDAGRPSDIPYGGWWQVAQRVFGRFGRDRILLISAGVTFYALLALFPATAALVSIFGLVADPEIIGQQIDQLSGVLPGGAVDIVGGQVKRIAGQSGGALGFGFVLGLVISLWSANAGMKSMFDALNVVYDEQEKRSFLKLNMQSLALTLGAMAFAIVAVGAIVVMPAVFAFLGLGEGTTGRIVQLARWPVLLIGVMFALAVLYRVGPSRDRPAWAWVTWGSALAAVVWLVGSLVFSWYVSNFGSYNETYGSLGAVIGFMTWIWLTSIVVLVGAELNAELEHQTARDTTVGPTKSLGQRGAAKADTAPRQEAA